MLGGLINKPRKYIPDNCKCLLDMSVVTDKVIAGTIPDLTSAGANPATVYGRPAVSFDGIDDYASTAAANSVFANSFVTSLWVKPTQLSRSDMLVYSATYGFLVYKSTSNNALVVRHWKATANEHEYTYFNNFFTSTAWAHVTVKFVVDGSNVTVTAYKNGVAFAATSGGSFNTGYGYGAGDFQFKYIGRDGGTSRASVLLKDIGVFETSVNLPSLMYNPPITSSRIFLKLNEGTGTALADSSGNGYNFTGSGIGWDLGANGGQNYLESDGSGGSQAGDTFKQGKIHLTPSMYLNCGKPSDFNVGFGDFTSCVAVKNLSFNGDVDWQLVDNKDSVTTAKSGWNFRLTSSQIVPILSDGTTRVFTTLSLTASSSKTYLIGIWRQGDNYSAFYIDNTGYYENPNTGATLSLDPAYNTVIGGRSAATVSTLRTAGVADIIKAFPCIRRKLSESELIAIYRSIL